ncbi:MAG: NAD(P)-dependent oxidoreductase [Chloroflexi bacterium]|nr:NAD(P)-dependent oxidoreductase [Chloroflexota bacterium]
MSEAMSIFVTAGTSPAGRALVRQLVAQGYRVIALTAGKAGADTARQDGALPVYADPTRAGELKSMLRMAQAQAVVNLLPVVPNTLLHDGHAWKGYDSLLKASTAALLTAAKDSGVGYFLHTSYTLLYGETHGAADENAPLNVPGMHPAFSAALESEGQVLESGLAAAVLRAGFLYGPQDVNLNLYAASLKMGKPFVAGAGKPAAWLHHEDLARACVLALAQQPKGEIFNIADDTPVSLAAFLDAYTHALGFNAGARLPGFLARLRVTAEQVTLLNTATQVSTAKAQTQLGWKAQYASYQQGIDQTLLVMRAVQQV